MRRLLRASVFTAIVVALAGCAAAPVTTVQRADGSTQTISWADYPGHAYIHATQVLAAPRAENIADHGHELMERIQSELASELGLDVEFADGDQWNDFESNGYGSPSLLRSYSCCSLSSEEVPTRYADWERVLAIVERISIEFGAGQLTLEQDQEELRENPDNLAQFDETWGTGIPGEYALLTALTRDSAQTVWLTIEDPSRRALATAAEKRVEPHISVEYSATVISTDDEAEFERRLAPFTGIQRPDSTEWD